MMTNNPALNRFFTLAAISLMLAAAAHGQPAPSRDLQSCSVLDNENERLHCFEDLSGRLDTMKGVSTLLGGWKLVRTPPPQGGPDIVSIMHASDSARSDLPIAGLMLRCSDSGIAVMVVMLGFHGAAPKVAVDGNPFEASAIQGGELLRLSRKATELANSHWQSVSELSIDVGLQPTPAHGVVPVTELAEAIRTLTQTCASK
jgi:hypothetical protein